MTNPRRSAAERLQARNLAETELQRYRGDHAAWHKHIHGVELDSMQILKCIEMDEHLNTIDFSCRRTGKTTVKELWLLKFLATNADQELGIVAPREAQAIVNLSFHLDSIRRSPVLEAFLDYKGGRTQISDTYFKLANRSCARSYGIMAQVDGGDLTAASLEEVDDMPRDRLFSRFLLMLGSSRRLGASKDSENKPQIRITGVWKGADTLSELVDSEAYHILPAVDCYLGVQLGILNAEFIDLMRDQLSPYEYLRQLMCRRISAKNFIWEKWVRRAMQVGLMSNISPASPLPGDRYIKRGSRLSFGLDAAGHGENAGSSRWALVATELVGNWLVFVYVRRWPAGAGEPEVLGDLVGLWEYFQPDHATGDAYAVGMLTALNDALFRKGLINVDRRSVGDGHSGGSTWPHWTFAPLRFEGIVKHQMAQALRSAFNHGRAVIPFFDDGNIEPETEDWRAFIAELCNVIAKPTKASYDTYQRAKTSLNDDLFDAAMAAVWDIVTGGTGQIDTLIQSAITTTREQLLGGQTTPLTQDIEHGLSRSTVEAA